MLGWPAIALDDAGNGATAWSMFGGVVAIRGALFRANSGWTQSTIIDANAGPTSNDFTYPDLVMRSDGTTIAIWTRVAPDTNRYLSASELY